MSLLSRDYFHDEAAAYEKLESIIWPNGPVCPHCGGTEKIYKIKPNPEKRVRHGLHKCGQCIYKSLETGGFGPLLASISEELVCFLAFGIVDAGTLPLRRLRDALLAPCAWHEVLEDDDGAADDDVVDGR